MPGKPRPRAVAKGSSDEQNQASCDGFPLRIDRLRRRQRFRRRRRGGSRADSYSRADPDPDPRPDTGTDPQPFADAITYLRYGARLFYARLLT